MCSCGALWGLCRMREDDDEGIWGRMAEMLFADMLLRKLMERGAAEVSLCSLLEAETKEANDG